MIKEKVYGFQFHPESFLTENGNLLIKKIFISIKPTKKLILKIFGAVMVCSQLCGFLEDHPRYFFLKNILKI